MSDSTFFSELSEQFNHKLPFVAYSKPNKPRATALLMQNSDRLDYQENTPGFIFSPFDNSEETIFFPLENCKELQTTVDLIPSDVQSDFQSDSVDTKERERYIKLIDKTIEEINSTNLTKVVMSRQEKIDTQIDPFQLFRKLLSTYSNALVYIWFHPEIGLWLGATPETLLNMRGKRFKTMALAGTQEFKGEMAVEWGNKEREEQQLVTDDIVKNCSNMATQLHISDVQTVKAGSLLHLKTSISGVLNPNKTVYDLIRSLHPTPAVCGMPKDLAKAFIKNNEYNDREYYTGFLGELHMTTEVSRNRNRKNVENNAYQSVSTTSNIFVNLRCVKLTQHTAHIFVGGGITASSNSELEWEETVHKSKIIKRLL